MAPGKYDLKIYQGDTFSMTVFLRQETNPVTPYDLTGWTAKAQMRSSGADAPVSLEFACAVDEEAGSITVSAAASATAQVTPGRYLYDLQITDGSIIQTVIRGSATVTGEVTKP